MVIDWAARRFQGGGKVGQKRWQWIIAQRERGKRER
jgi:hypothetical protein